MGSKKIKGMVVDIFAEEIFCLPLTYLELGGHIYPPENVRSFGF